MNLEQTTENADTANSEIKPAGFSSRAMAYCIDLTFLSCLYFGTYFALGTILFGKLEMTTSAIATAGLLYAFLLIATPLVLSCCYYTLLHATSGQTLGKIFMAIRVESTDHRPLTYGQSFLRWCGSFVSLMPLGLGYLWSFIDSRQAGWHDKIAGSQVVRL